jgi:CBS-domain-containing membrane protein
LARRFICFSNGIDQLNTKVSETVAKDITRIIRSLQTTAVNRCRERLDEAAVRARDMISRGENGDERAPAYVKKEYGVTSVLKRRHGL